MAVYRIEHSFVTPGKFVIYKKVGWWRGWKKWSDLHYNSVLEAEAKIKDHERYLQSLNPVYVYTGKDECDGW